MADGGVFQENYRQATGITPPRKRFCLDRKMRRITGVLAKSVNSRQGLGNLKSPLEEFVELNEQRLQDASHKGLASSNQYASYWRDEIDGFWEITNRNIGIAGVIYILLIPPFFLRETLATAADSTEILKFCFSVLVSLFPAFVLAMFLANIISVFVTRFFESIEMQTDRLPVAILVGGLTGLCATSVLIYPAMMTDSFSPLQQFILLATAFGQIGAAVGVGKVLWNKRPDPEATNRWPRFSLRYMLTASVVVALGFGGLKMIGVPLERLMGFLGLWLVVLIGTELLLLGIARLFRRALNPDRSDPRHRDRLETGLGIVD